MVQSVTIHLSEVFYFTTSLVKFIELGENKSGLAADTLSVILTAKTLKLRRLRTGYFRRN